MGVHGDWRWLDPPVSDRREQKQQWLPPMHRMEKIGAFGLTERSRSAVAGGLTPRRGVTMTAGCSRPEEMDRNATFADVTSSGRATRPTTSEGFWSRKDTPGFTAEKMEGKMHCALCRTR